MTDKPPRVTYYVTLAISLDPQQVKAGLLDPPERWDWKTLLHEDVKVIAHAGPVPE